MHAAKHWPLDKGILGIPHTHSHYPLLTSHLCSPKIASSTWCLAGLHQVSRPTVTNNLTRSRRCFPLKLHVFPAQAPFPPSLPRSPISTSFKLQSAVSPVTPWRDGDRVSGSPSLSNFYNVLNVNICTSHHCLFKFRRTAMQG